MTTRLCEYIWLDGSIPTRQLRSKARAIELPDDNALTINDFPAWSFDGSSTNQATGDDSDCLLQPVAFVYDPLEDGGDYLVMCEVQNPDGSEHASNSRAQLRQILDAGASSAEPWFGFEQEYTMFENSHPLGWPEAGYPAPQGPYYCGVGSKQIFGRELATHHAQACMEAGIMYYGMNAEVMPGQWEYQVGYRGVSGESGNALKVCDHAWLARWLLHRISEYYNIHVSLENKPIKGDWNGAGMHTNFSTSEMRDASTGRAAFKTVVERLSQKHMEHIALYGDKNAERLVGGFEAPSIDEFSAGEADRNCSIRIPRSIETKGCGYLEDRRPGANADPYLVAARIIATICAVSEDEMQFTSWPRQSNLKRVA